MLFEPLLGADFWEIESQHPRVVDPNINNSSSDPGTTFLLYRIRILPSFKDLRTKKIGIFSENLKKQKINITGYHFTNVIKTLNKQLVLMHQCVIFFFTFW